MIEFLQLRFRREQLMTFTSQVGYLRCVVACLMLCFMLSGCGPSKVTKANFDKIQNDMTLKQVEELLGEGTSQGGDGSNVAAQFGIDVTGGAAPSATVDYVWQSGKNSITVTFTRGKVTAKRGSGL
jgi:hypothetical protein